jgi:hypothetical protein
MGKVGLKDWIIPLSVVGALWIRWVVGLGSYSGTAQWFQSTRLSIAESLLIRTR